MLPRFLVHEDVRREDGTSVPLEVGSVQQIDLKLVITQTREQESLVVSLEGSPDGVEWEKRPLFAFPQKFYCGTYTRSIDLSQHPEVRYLRARWTMNSWSRTDARPSFAFYLRAEFAEVAAMAASV